jgi:hypothetical protein
MTNLPQPESTRKPALVAETAKKSRLYQIAGHCPQAGADAHYAPTA